MRGKEHPDWIRLTDVPMYYYHQTADKLPTEETVRNWVKRGRRDRCGDQAKLKAQLRKGLWMTRKAWVDEFIRRMTRVAFNEVA